ncbi:MAG: S8 family serine peptidase [Microlunatus sp.]
MTISSPARARRLLASFLGLTMIVGALIATTDPAAAKPSSPGRYLVLSSSDSVDRPVAKAERLGGDVVHTFEHVTDGFSAELTPAQAEKLETDPSIDEVIPMKRYQMAMQTNAAVTQSTAPWGLDRIDQRKLPLNSKYAYTSTGAGSTVFVLDSGIRLTHTQFQGRAVSGWDFVDEDSNAGDCYGHGTHVAGTIAGSTYGVAKSARLVSVRVLDCGGGGWPDDVIAGLEWAVAHKPATGPALVNMSLGFSIDDAQDQAVADLVDAAVNSAVDEGLSVVVAAGNDGEDSCDFSPARAELAITVAAGTSSDARASFSNLGSCVDLYAPGDNIRSASNGSNTSLAYESGTSMATPHVSGVAARMLQDNPLASPASLTDEIIARSTPDVITGADAADTPNRLLYVAPPTLLAGAPTKLTISKSLTAKSATVRWATPSSNGGSAITGYRVIRTGSTDSKSKRVVVADLSATARSHTFTGLNSGGSYSVRVLALTANGPGAGAAATVRMYAKPGKPGIKKASSGTKKSKGISVTARWKKPTSGGPVASYQVKADRLGSSKNKTVKVKAGVYQVKITGLAKNKKYKITVRAVNAEGASSWSKKSNTVKAK